MNKDLIAIFEYLEREKGIKRSIIVNAIEESLLAAARKSLKELLNVPAGEVVSYGELAKRVGIPYGARFVGNVMMKNRFGPIVPCHRVILSSGRLGKFAGRSNHPMKRRLLEQENAKFKD